jgi:hypothetical protein
MAKFERSIIQKGEIFSDGRKTDNRIIPGKSILVLFFYGGGNVQYV